MQLKKSELLIFGGIALCVAFGVFLGFAADHWGIRKLMDEIVDFAPIVLGILFLIIWALHKAVSFFVFLWHRPFCKLCLRWIGAKPVSYLLDGIFEPNMLQQELGAGNCRILLQNPDLSYANFLRSQEQDELSNLSTKIEISRCHRCQKTHLLHVTSEWTVVHRDSLDFRDNTYKAMPKVIVRNFPLDKDGYSTFEKFYASQIGKKLQDARERSQDTFGIMQEAMNLGMIQVGEITLRWQDEVWQKEQGVDSASWLSYVNEEYQKTQLKQKQLDEEAKRIAREEQRQAEKEAAKKLGNGCLRWIGIILALLFLTFLFMALFMYLSPD